MGYDAEGSFKLATPSLLAGLFQAAPQFSPFSVDKVSMKSILMAFRHPSTHCPFVKPFLASIVDEVLQPLASASALFL
jgi:hypothetical protein